LLGWFAAGGGAAVAKVLINEIHHSPDVKTDRVEFIELHNSGPEAVSLSGWRLADAVQFAFPGGASIGPGGFLVVAQDPASVLRKYGAASLGPWTGLLSNEGERIVLLNAAGGVEDAVDYQLGFPWPTVGDPPGYSIELANPGFDNDLGGNWRVSVAGNPAQQNQTLISQGAEWRYLKGLDVPSAPATAWREMGFDDSAWATGAAPIGYDASLAMRTPLDDMNGRYTSFFLRRKFVVDDPAIISSLVLEALYDDGFKLWINGVNVLDMNMPSGEAPYDAVSTGSARESNNYDTINLDNPGAYLRAGENVIAVQVHNILLTRSSDCFFDARLVAQTGPSGRGPTPGRVNSVFTSDLPPQIRQVDHSPNQPSAGQPVTVTAKVTDAAGVTGVSLQYQLVDPGNYIELADPAYSANWNSVPMNDTGEQGDARAGDSVYTVTLPGSMQQHRRLVRYRITATDSKGLGVTVPYGDDPQPNFAWFCYNGVPAWQGAVRPGSTPTLTFGTNEMGRLPVVHLISKKTSVEDATWLNRYGGDAYLWSGTLVYDGTVYDHIRYRARGGVWRYAMVKNMWKFDLNRGHEIQMRDDYGRPYKTKWNKLNLGASIQQGDYNHRGEQGMFESVGFRLFNLAGVPTCNTTFLQFRIIDDVREADPATQYEGDFWGVYLAVEQENGRFLDEHGLPDGNFYKMEGGTGELSNAGLLGPTDKSDLNAFLAGQNSGSPASWWRANWYLPNGYSYQAIVQAIHHYDIAAGKNYYYYRNPITGLWTVHPWDLDLTWADNMYDAGGQGGEVFKSYAIPKPELNLEYRNRVREIRDLLFNTDQTWLLIDEYAGLLRGPATGPTILDADRCQWDYNPKMAGGYSSAQSKAGQGRFYQWPNEPEVSKDFNGCIQLMKNYVIKRGALLDSLASDAGIPAKPTVAYHGPANYALNRLAFRCSNYSGSNPFAAMRWRVGEVTDTSAPAYDPAEPRKYEIAAVWESDELSAFAADVTIPSGVIKVGHAYRVRARMKDTTGRWSNWSAPVQFVAGLPDNAAELAANLRLTELMVDPPEGNDYEYIELRNTSAGATLDLEGARFTAGVDFTFGPGTTIAPGGYLVVVKTTNQSAFRARYALPASVPLAGPYSGSLANNGEQLNLKTGAGGTDVFSFEFGGSRAWPVAARGAGHSLVPLDRALNGQASGALDYPGNWRASAFIGGSPGRADPEPPSSSVLLNEIAAHTDYADPTRPEYDSNDWIELHNVTGAGVNLEGWYLSDDPANLRKWAVPSVTVPARGWVTFDEVSGFHSPITTGFGLDKAGEQLLLSRLRGDGEDRVVDAYEYKGQANAVSVGRHPDGGAWWYAMAWTSNSVNSAPLPGPVISELMYHPPDLGTNDNTRDEYIEIHNPGPGPVSLQDTNGSWRLDGGIGLVFPPNTAIPAGGVLLVVNFTPADAAAVETFRGVYGLTNQLPPLVGPYSGKLGNRGDRVAMERPQHPDLPGDSYSWVVVDEVVYGNQDPWPARANGRGEALHRAAFGRSGNDPANWPASAPTPGLVTGTNPDRDNDGLPDAWEARYGLDPSNPNDAAADADGDGLSNLEEFLSGTDPRDGTSALRLEAVLGAEAKVTLRFTALAGKSYSVLFGASLDAGGWRKVADVPAGPSSGPVEVTDPAGSGFATRFYRLVTPALP
jgi:hypothetical protein